MSNDDLNTPRMNGGQLDAIKAGLSHGGHAQQSTSFCFPTSANGDGVFFDGSQPFSMTGQFHFAVISVNMGPRLMIMMSC